MAIGDMVVKETNNAATTATLTMNGTDAATGRISVKQILHATTATVTFSGSNISIDIDNLNGAGVSQGNSILLDGNNSDSLKVKNGGSGTADFAIYGKEVRPA